MKTILLPEANGDCRTINITDDGDYICPVCGFAESTDPPWYYSDDKTGIIPSNSICSSCKVEYGYDDFVSELMPRGSVDAVNWTLRIRWLDNHGWEKSQLDQLQKYLDITEAHARAYKEKLEKAE